MCFISFILAAKVHFFFEISDKMQSFFHDLCQNNTAVPSFEREVDGI